MYRFKQFINESFKNAIGDSPLKDMYADQVWDILQKSYAGIGGIKGSGFSTKQDMIDNIPMWKMAVKDGAVEVVIMYKDKGGRKSVAMGSTGSDYARKKIPEMFTAELKRSYGEKSKAALGTVLKMYPEHVITPFLHDPDRARGILPNKTLVTPIKDVHMNDWPEDAKFTISKYPFIKDYGYLRYIAGKPTFKVMVGTPGLGIR